jgi:hypothetical protein
MRYFSLQLVFLLALTTNATQLQNPTSADDYSQRGIALFEERVVILRFEYADGSSW